MLPLKIAFRNIFRQRRRSLLTGFSMTGGYMLFAFTVALTEGSYSNIIEIFTLDNTGHIQIHKGDYLDRPRIYKTIRERRELESHLAQHGDVKSFTPRVFSAALAYAGNKTATARVVGIDANTEPDVTRIRETIAEGTYFSSQPNADGYFTTMIGQGLAKRLKLGVGDEIVLISSGADGSIANDIYVVSAIIGNRQSFDRMTAYLPLAAAQEFLSLGSDVHQYTLLVNNSRQNVAVAERLQSELPDLVINPWQVVEETFYRTMQLDQDSQEVIMQLVIVIVFIGVLNTVLMSVLERTREFGVLRSLGCRPVELVKMIVLETLMLTSISVLVGMILVSPIIYWFHEVGLTLPAPVDMGGVSFEQMKGDFAPGVFIQPMIFMLVVAIVISLLPALRAARIMPKDALGAF